MVPRGTKLKLKSENKLGREIVKEWALKNTQ